MTLTTTTSKAVNSSAQVGFASTRRVGMPPEPYRFRVLDLAFRV